MRCYILDDLAYHYVSGKPNLLDHVTDAASPSGSEENVPSQPSGNYTYDAIGNIIADAQEGTTMAWDVYGKLQTVIYSSGDTTTYTYDTQGNRLTKRDSSGMHIYIRDASGNVLSIIHTSEDQGTTRDTLKEQILYGSSRLGILQANRFIASTDTTEILDSILTESTRTEKQYELSNHLGNVLTVLSDHALGQDTDTNDVADYYASDLISATDYYPFGMLARRSQAQA